MSSSDSNDHEFVKTHYRRAAASLRRYVRKRLRAGEPVDDVTQEIWVRLMRVANPERIEEPLAYIYKVAARVITDFRAGKLKLPVMGNQRVQSRGPKKKRLKSRFATG